MSYRGTKFSERAADSAAAKKALLERFQNRPKPDDPAVLARAAERKAIEEAREQRMAEKRTAKEAEAARLRAEEEERQAEIARQAAEEAARAVQAKLDAAALLLQQKAARDARYAARKARR